jgi:hypothetical protein
VIAPLLLNFYINFVVKQALAEMPDGCGVKLAYRADGKLQSMDHSKGATRMELISLLLYTDDNVLLSSKEDELVVMLKVMGKVSAGLGLRINASKTKIMAIPGHAKGAGAGVGTEDVEGCQGVEINEGMVEVVTQFKYLGSMLVNDGKLDVELAARETKAVFRFRQFRRCGAPGICLWPQRLSAIELMCYPSCFLEVRRGACPKRNRLCLSGCTPAASGASWV